LHESLGTAHSLDVLDNWNNSTALWTLHALQTTQFGLKLAQKDIVSILEFGQSEVPIALKSDHQQHIACGEPR
jgi:hypothetical protein